MLLPMENIQHLQNRIKEKSNGLNHVRSIYTLKLHCIKLDNMSLLLDVF